MSEEFLRTPSGAVNLRYVRRIRQIDRPESHPRHFAILDDGEEWPVEMGRHALDGLCNRLVPAAAGQAGVFLSVDDDKENPTVEDVWVERVQIVAWAISTNYGGTTVAVPEPIFADTPCSNHYVFVEGPDGSFMEPNIGTLSSLLEAKHYALRLHIERRAARDKHLAGAAAAAAQEAGHG